MSCWKSFWSGRIQKSFCGRHRRPDVFFFNAPTWSHARAVFCDWLANLAACIFVVSFAFVQTRRPHLCKLWRGNVTARTSTFRHPSAAADVAVFTWRFFVEVFIKEKRSLFDIAFSVQLCLLIEIIVTYGRIIAPVSTIKLFLNYFLLFFLWRTI